jgi:thymidylate synthase ThyX
MSQSESFTSEQKALLEPYVTNTDRSVFVLTNLPEVIKGALFSRYSRSTLGLRNLLLKEFVLSEDSEFRENQGNSGKTTSRESSELAIERARKFYDRILDGYGDDSIGELGGAHLALENISMLATKVLEDARIGGSPLEKSTRYVSFSEKHDGRYRYYRDPKLMDSGYAKHYTRACDHLFDSYVKLCDPIWAHVRKLLPREDGTSEAAYERSVKARGYDLIRGLLPAATQTNMGIFGNGRFFETLIRKLRLDPLQENRDLGQSSFDELSKVIPSFIRRADRNHPRFQDYEDYTNFQKGLLNDFYSEKFSIESVPPQDMEVRLVEFDTNAENRLLAALLFPFSHASLQELLQKLAALPEDQKKQLIQEYSKLRLNRRDKPGRGLEMPFYTFDLVGDYGIYRDLQRHRMLTQERQLLSTSYGYEKPEEIEEAGLGSIFDDAMLQAAEVYENLLKDFPHEAQYVVPMGYRIRWFVKINLRSLSWLTELRSVPQGHTGYRRIAQQMYLRVKEVHPTLADLMKFVDLEDYPLGRLESEVRQEAKKQSL